MHKIEGKTCTYQLVCIHLLSMSDTRQRILEKNFAVMHKHGYQGTRADKVVKELGVSKGAFYHYFDSKQALGYAIVDEIIGPLYLELWERPSRMQGHAIENLISLLRQLMENQPEEKIGLGCPLNNLIQEMSPLDEGFRTRLNRVVERMEASVAQTLRRGQHAGQVRDDIDVEAAAIFVVSSVEGAFGIAKTRRSPAALEAAMQQLIKYLTMLSTES